MVDTAQAYAACLDLAREHYENFPVASRLLPRRTRPHIAAIYAFARIADDFADEGERTDAERVALLEDWRERLHGAARGRVADDGSAAAAVFTALAATIAALQLDVQPFDDLISAFLQDVRVKRYATWADLMDYCRRSANPVGRLVLRVHGYRAPELDRRSDALCSALQLVNFWQDLEVDCRKGRVYLPAEILLAAGADEGDLARGVLTPEWRRALHEAGARTRALFDEGRDIADMVGGRLHWELRATWLGGVRILDLLAERGFDVFGSRPTLHLPDAALVLWRALTWRRRSAAAPPF